MEIFEFGNPASPIVLIQPTGVHELKSLQEEYNIIKDIAKTDFSLKCFPVNNWNNDLSPWEAPAVFGNEGFGGNGETTLNEIVSYCNDSSKSYFIGGYSLAGLFSLWASAKTDLFKGAAASSPSVWFPGFDEYINSHPVNCDIIYLSLGDKEEKTKNKVMAKVGDNIRSLFKLLIDNGKDVFLEWNEGNHFKDATLRTAKGFGYLLNNYKS